MRRPHAATGLSLVALVSVGVAAQQAPRRDQPMLPVAIGSASISGVVVNDLTSRPVRRVTVTVSTAEGGLRWAAVTDDDGSFSVGGLPAGRYVVGASKPAYVPLAFGAKRPNHPGLAMALADGQARSGLTLRLMPGGVLTGTVRGPTGEPVPGARIAMLHSALDYDTGQKTLQAVSRGLGNLTDDRGTYRVYGLPPDDYYLVVSVGALIRSAAELHPTTAAEVDWAKHQISGQAVSGGGPAPPLARAVDYAPVFYPGSTSETNATVVSLKEGEERGGLDIVLDLTPTAKISGSVVRQDGGPLPQTLQISVVAQDAIPGIPFSGFTNARVDRNGRFASTGLPPGDYTVTVRVPPGRGGGPAMPGTFGLTTVTLNGNDVDTTVTLTTGASVSGRLVFQGTTLKPPADLSQVRVTLTAARSSAPTLGVAGVTADASGTFTIPGVTPGRYQLSAAPGGGWLPIRAMIAGHDAIDVPVEIGTEDITGAEITLTDQPTELSGTLVDATGQPAPDYTIILFPADRTAWVPRSRRIQAIRPASDGHYRAQNLLPGDYLIAAVTDVEQNEWFDPSFLGQLVAAATKVTLAEGDKKVQNLKLSGG